LIGLALLPVVLQNLPVSERERPTAALAGRV
jgi:hypothetical protein